MSTVKKQLRELRKKIGRGGFVKIAAKIGCSPEWVGQVMRDESLAVKHSRIIDAAVEFVNDREESAAMTLAKISEAIK